MKLLFVEHFVFLLVVWLIMVVFDIVGSRQSAQSWTKSYDDLEDFAELGKQPFDPDNETLLCMSYGTLFCCI